MQPSKRKNKKLQVCLRESELNHIKDFLSLKGIDARDLLLSATYFHQLQKSKIQQGV